VAGESLEDVRERFRRIVELGRADENDDYIIFRWERGSRRWVMNHWSFPCYFPVIPVPDPAVLRIPTKPAMHSNVKPATCSDPKPAGVPI